MRRRPSGLPLRDGPREGHTVKIIVFLTAILSGSATLASQYNQLPWWYAYPLALFTLVSVVVLVTHFLWPPFIEWLSRSRDRRRLDAAARAVFPEFEDIVRRFQELINLQTQDTLPTFFWNLRNQEPAWKSKLPAIPQLLFMSELFDPFLRRFREWDETYEQLRELAHDFWTFLHQYDSSYVLEPLNTLRNLGNDDVPESVRHKVNALRENYAAFVREYTTFAKRANAKFGMSPFVDYIRVPEPV